MDPADQSACDYNFLACKWLLKSLMKIDLYQTNSINNVCHFHFIHLVNFCLKLMANCYCNYRTFECLLMFT